MKVKQEREKVGLKLNIHKTKIMASGPITSWQIDGETMEIVTDFIFLCSKITADGACIHEIKMCLLFGRKTMTKLDSLLKRRYITLLTKRCLTTCLRSHGSHMETQIGKARCLSETAQMWMHREGRQLS